MATSAAAAFFERAQQRSFSFSCSIDANIPQSRGLGSSAAVRVGVLTGLNELANRPLQRRDIFEIAAHLEGHPDNAAPACYGGFNVVRGLDRLMFTVSARLHFILLIPNFEIATSEARRLLPARIDRLQAVENSRNACAITAGFASREYQALAGGFGDHLHQPFRKKLIPFLDKVIAAAENAGALGAFLSGSGSTICAIALCSPEKISEAMLAASVSPGAQTLLTAADNRGARVLSPRNPQSAIRNSSYGSAR
jgi:homoserine kinase